MSDFDDAYAPADASFFRRAGKPAVIYDQEPGTGRPITVVDDSPEETNSFRVGGRVDEASIEFETDRATLTGLPKLVGMKVLFEAKSYRVLRLRPQGGTLTLICGPVADASPDAW